MTTSAVSDGELAGRYRLLRQIGSGGFGSVWEAHDRHLRSRVAVKISLVPEGVDRFKREARIGAVLGRLPGFLRVLDFDRVGDGRTFMVMDLLDGAVPLALSAHSASLGAQRFPGYWDDRAEFRRVALWWEAASRVAAAHRARVVHRDLKPSNFLLYRQRLFLTDFGLAKVEGTQEEAPREVFTPGITSTGVAAGTRYYMAPEQFEDFGRASFAADVYSLGVMLFEALMGEVPYADVSPDFLPAEHYKVLIGERPPPRPAASFDGPGASDIVAVCARSLAIKPDARFGDAREMMRAIPRSGWREHGRFLPRPAAALWPTPEELRRSFIESSE